MLKNIVNIVACFGRFPYGLNEPLFDTVQILAHMVNITNRSPKYLGFEGGRSNAYKLLNLRALKFSPVNKMHIFQCMGKIFCVEFQRVPLKFYTKYLTHILKDAIAIFIKGKNLRTLRFNSWWAFLKRSPPRHPIGTVPSTHPCVFSWLWFNWKPLFMPSGYHFLTRDTFINAYNVDKGVRCYQTKKKWMEYL